MKKPVSKPAVKSATKSAIKPATKPAAAKAKSTAPTGKPPARKPPTKPAVRPSRAKPKAAVKPPVSAPAKAPIKPSGSASVVTPAKKAAALDSKVKKQKTVRDSFNMPAADYALIPALKKRALGTAMEVKKSELLRAGLRLLAGLSDLAYREALKSLPAVKSGRPKKK